MGDTGRLRLKGPGCVDGVKGEFIAESGVLKTDQLRQLLNEGGNITFSFVSGISPVAAAAAASAASSTSGVGGGGGSGLAAGDPSAG